MFQREIGEVSKHLTKVFGITDDILFVGYNVDDKDYDDRLQIVL